MTPAQLAERHLPEALALAERLGRRMGAGSLPGVDLEQAAIDGLVNALEAAADHPFGALLRVRVRNRVAGQVEHEIPRRHLSIEQLRESAGGFREPAARESEAVDVPPMFEILARLPLRTRQRAALLCYVVADCNGRRAAGLMRVRPQTFSRILGQLRGVVMGRAG